MDPQNPPSTDPRSLRQLLAPEAEELELGGNRPLDLAAGDRLWLVTAGRVEIFAVPGDGSAAARTHLATAGAGQMLASLDAGRRSFARLPSPSPAVTLLAVAHPGTRLFATRPSVFTRLAREPSRVPALAAAIDGWVSALGDGVPRHRAPRRFAELRPGGEMRLGGDDEERTARSGGVVWVRQVAGRSHFLGREELALEEAWLFPLCAATWLESDGESLLSCVTTGHLLRSGTLWEGLGRFHQIFLRYVAQELAAGEEDDERRIVRRRELDTVALDAAAARLAAVLTPSSRLPAAAPEIGDPLFAACRLVAEPLGLEMRRPPPGSPPAKSGGEPGPGLRRIGDASRVRFRRVLLRDDWWRHDNGPLLGFVDEEKRPVALLSTSATSYQLADPETGVRTPVDARLAATLAGDAYMFYPPLPERPVAPRDLLRLAFGGRRRDLWTILLMGLGGGLLSVLVPIVTELLYGRVIPGADRPRLLQMFLVLAVAALGAAAFQITRQIAVLRLTGKIDGSVQAAVWNRLLALPSAFFRRFTVGDLTSRAMGVDRIRNLLLGHVTTSFLGLVFSAFSFALLFYYSVELAFLATALIAILVASTAVLAYLQLTHQRALLALEGRIASLVFGLIRGVSKLRTAGAEARAFALWSERFAEQRRRTVRARRLANVQTTFNAVYGLAALAALFAMMGLALESGLSVSRFLAFSAAFGQVQAAALSFASLISGLLSMVPIYERLSPILEEVPEVDETKLEAGELSGEVELGHVVFRYQEDGPLILRDVSLSVRPGEFVALVGPSGAGKSTVLRLLLGFEAPNSGSIYYDGQDLSSLDLQSVRRQIGVVLQNSRPMSGDIFTNIVGSSELGIDAAWEAARMAGLEEDIRAMPMGMHTVISEGAGTFSGGQVQRLMIARALVHRPRILFFDEATSALDNRTQDIVSRSLERLQATRIVVAHRLSTIRHADRIYVFEAGRVVEEGSYDELVARGGVFTRLVERQVA